MLALVLDEELHLVSDYPKPKAQVGEALIRTRLAGICGTDLEMLRGYKGFRGVLGHEFVGQVIACSAAEDRGDCWKEEWIGKRVVGEINIGCGECDFCRKGIPSHCQSREALGVVKRGGAFAEYLTLPLANLHRIPDELSDEVAVFAEPLAAALQVLSLVHIQPQYRVGVIGDGKLGLLVAQVLATTGVDLTVIGRHPGKLALVEGWGINVGSPDGLLDVVVDCTGNPSGLVSALKLVKPQGCVVLKSTFQGTVELDLNQIVVDEIRLVGSRCGPFEPAIQLLRSGRIDVLSLIEACYPLTEALSALEHAGQRGALKVLIRP